MNTQQEIAGCLMQLMDSANAPEAMQKTLADLPNDETLWELYLASLQLSLAVIKQIAVNNARTAQP